MGDPERMVTYTDVPSTQRVVALFCENEKRIQPFRFAGVRVAVDPDTKRTYSVEMFACERCKWQRIYGARG